MMILNKIVFKDLERSNIYVYTISPRWSEQESCI